MPKPDYIEREMEIRAYLRQKLEGDFRIPRFYTDKPDFGDMDVLVAARDDWHTLRFAVAADLGITQHKIVGHVFSSVYRNLQVDFFTVPAPHLEMMYSYMSFNDLGNIIGKMFRRFNLKYGEYGLFYVFRRQSDEHYKKDLFICADMPRILEFLGLDAAPWQQGFANLEQMFSWVIQSKYFSVAPYLDEPAGHMEKRLETRPTMQRFAEFLRQNNVQNRPEFLERHAYVPQIAAAFPEANLPEQIAAEERLEVRAVQLAQKFNGQLVMRLRPELEGKRLGEFIKGFKQRFADFEEFLLESSAEEIEKAVLESRF